MLNKNLTTALTNQIRDQKPYAFHILGLLTFMSSLVGLLALVLIAKFQGLHDFSTPLEFTDIILAGAVTSPIIPGSDNDPLKGIARRGWVIGCFPVGGHWEHAYVLVAMLSGIPLDYDFEDIPENARVEITFLSKESSGIEAWSLVGSLFGYRANSPLSPDWLRSDITQGCYSLLIAVTKGDYERFVHEAAIKSGRFSAFVIVSLIETYAAPRS